MYGLILTRKQLRPRNREMIFEEIKFTHFMPDVVTEIQNGNLVLFIDDGKIKIIKDFLKFMGE